MEAKALKKTTEKQTENTTENQCLRRGSLRWYLKGEEWDWKKSGKNSHWNKGRWKFQKEILKVHAWSERKRQKLAIWWSWQSQWNKKQVGMRRIKHQTDWKWIYGRIRRIELQPAVVVTGQCKSERWWSGKWKCMLCSGAVLWETWKYVCNIGVGTFIK